MNQNYFIKNCHVPEPLTEEVINQVGDWEDFETIAPDVVNHGADSGFHGFTYYNETVTFAENNLKRILQYCRDLAEDIGLDGAYSIIAGFNCLNNDYAVDEVADIINGHYEDEHDKAMVFNALAWFALEEVCRSYVDILEDQDV